jgi:hypothetical protein
MRHRLEDSADAWLDANAAGVSGDANLIEQIVANRRTQRRGWYAAAVFFLLAVAGWWPRLTEVAGDAAAGISPLQAAADRGREHLLKSGQQQIGRWAWSHENGVEAQVHGDVVWDGEHQQGYLTLAGLPPSVESGGQYQLWIFDGARDDRYPVDGGVFDVPAGAGQLTVPIRPALKVSKPVMFAITLEPSGGVVVSDRQHLMTLARASEH